VVVDGVGAVALPTPPVGAAYHKRLLPVAVKALAVAFWQYVTGLDTVGAAGIAFTVKLIGIAALEHPPALVTNREPLKVVVLVTVGIPLIVIDAPREVEGTSGVSPAACAAASQLIL
jgi:hypothetical protein